MLQLHWSDKRQTANTGGIQASQCIPATITLMDSVFVAGLEANLFQTSTAGSVCPAYR